MRRKLVRDRIDWLHGHESYDDHNDVHLDLHNDLDDVIDVIDDLDLDHHHSARHVHNDDGTRLVHDYDTARSDYHCAFGHHDHFAHDNVAGRLGINDVHVGITNPHSHRRGPR